MIVPIEPVEHQGVWWSRREDGIIIGHDPETDTWSEWDPDQPGPVPPFPEDDDRFSFESPEVLEIRKLREFQGRVVFWVIVIVLLGLVAFGIHNYFESQDAAQREADEIMRLLNP